MPEHLRCSSLVPGARRPPGGSRRLHCMRGCPLQTEKSTCMVTACFDTRRPCKPHQRGSHGLAHPGSSRYCGGSPLASRCTRLRWHPSVVSQASRLAACSCDPGSPSRLQGGATFVRQSCTSLLVPKQTVTACS